jgi:hypothetical protein
VGPDSIEQLLVTDLILAGLDGLLAPMAQFDGGVHAVAEDAVVGVLQALALLYCQHETKAALLSLYSPAALSPTSKEAMTWKHDA